MPNNIGITKQPVSALGEYASVPMTFESESVFRVVAPEGCAGLVLREERLEKPFFKDYDAPPGEGPEAWARQWDISGWDILAAFDGEKRAGGAIVAYHTPGLNFLDGRADMAALWDIRICDEFRGRGIGRALFAAAEKCAREKGCSLLKIETQNNNVPACRFYEAMGCRLGAIVTGAYREFPDEAQLIWYKKL